jgi:tetratricopeptide (TPR) repeat protein
LYYKYKTYGRKCYKDDIYHDIFQKFLEKAWKKPPFTSAATNAASPSMARSKTSEGSEARRAKRIADRAARADSKRAKPLQKFEGHEQAQRKQAIARKINVARLLRLTEREEKVLRGEPPPPPPEEPSPEIKAKRRRRDFYDMDTSQWQLRGPARPPLPYDAPPPNPHYREKGEDMYEKYKGEFGAHECCHPYLHGIHELGKAYRVAEDLPSAIKWLSLCLELDPSDSLVGAHRQLVAAHVDAGDLKEAAAILNSFEDKGGREQCASYAWTRAAVAFGVSKDPGTRKKESGLLLAAASLNPYIAWQIAYSDTFEEVMEPDLEDSEPPEPGSIEESFAYFVGESGSWDKIEGAREWVRAYLEGGAVPPPEPLPEGPYGEIFAAAVGEVLERRGTPM